MAKRCTICEEDARFCIKGSSECYCEECATEHFSDLNLLQKVKGEVEALKEAIKGD